MTLVLLFVFPLVPFTHQLPAVLFSNPLRPTPHVQTWSSRVPFLPYGSIFLFHPSAACRYPAYLTCSRIHNVLVLIIVRYHPPRYPCSRLCCSIFSPRVFAVRFHPSSGSFKTPLTLLLLSPIFFLSLLTCLLLPCLLVLFDRAVLEVLFFSMDFLFGWLLSTRHYSSSFSPASCTSLACSSAPSQVSVFRCTGLSFMASTLYKRFRERLSDFFPRTPRLLHSSPAVLKDANHFCLLESQLFVAKLTSLSHGHTF